MREGRSPLMMAVSLSIGVFCAWVCSACLTTQPLWKTKGRCHPDVSDRIFDDDDYRETWSCWHHNRLKQLKRWFRHQTHGLTESWHKNGSKHCQINYVYGAKEGLGRCWFENGQIAREENYKSGLKHGTTTVWFKNGKKRSVRMYVRGQKHGPARTWYKNGSKRTLRYYKRNERSGIAKRWSPSGQLLYTGRFRHGAPKRVRRNWHKHGRFQRWNREGILTYDCNWRHGLRDGRCMYRLWSGKVQCSRHYQKGLLHGKAQCVQDANGRSFQAHLKQGKRHGVWQGWYTKQQKWYVASYQEGEPNGRWRSWHPNGKPQYEEYWQRGLAHGTWRSWHIQGKQLHELTYQKGFLEGSAKEWHPNGQKLRQATYHRGVLCGVTKEWDPTGKQLKTRQHRPCQAPPGPPKPLTISLLIDTSGSMSGSRIYHAKKAALRLARHIPAHVLLQIIQFGYKPSTLLPLAKMTTHRRQQAELYLQTLKASGGTSLTLALVLAFKKLQQSKRKGESLVLLLTDGQDRRRKLETTIRAMRRQGITVSTFALGYGSNHKLLRTCAKWGGGRFYKASPARRLHTDLQQELSKFALQLPRPHGLISTGFSSFASKLKREKLSKERSLNKRMNPATGARTNTPLPPLWRKPREIKPSKP